MDTVTPLPAQPNAPPPVPAAAAPQRFFPIPVDSLDHQALQMDLYIKYAQAGAPTLYRSAGLEFNAKDTTRLAEQGVKFLYIAASQHALYRKLLADKLDRAFSNPEIAREQRARIVRDACSKMIEDVMLFPGDSEPIEAVADISRNFASWSNKDPEAFSYLLDMSKHDFYTATHMINVGVGCGLLGREIFPGDENMFSLLVQGGLLHDLGKRGVPEAILNKEGKLEPEEWKVIQSHPRLGYEELKANRAVSQTVLEMIRDHHERIDGNGYPFAISGDQISVAARICAIVDVFDAITAARSYRGPTPPDKTLVIMSEGLGTQFDAALFGTWKNLVQKLVHKDPARAAVTDTAKPSIASLSDVTPRSPLIPATSVSGINTSAIWQDDRRQFKRFECELPIKATFLRQLKKCPVGPGVAFVVRLLDVSRGGAQIQTAWPITLNDLLILEIPMKLGGNLTRHGRVVRVRQQADTWRAGILFVDDTKD
ncbi:MAG: HD domain-containing protein [Phycisphaerales bacterium]|nr:HD domain-containing protein [Phycisphaerales bacterium]